MWSINKMSTLSKYLIAAALDLYCTYPETKMKKFFLPFSKPIFKIEYSILRSRGRDYGCHVFTCSTVLNNCKMVGITLVDKKA